MKFPASESNLKIMQSNQIGTGANSLIRIDQQAKQNKNLQSSSLSTNERIEEESLDSYSNQQESDQLSYSAFQSNESIVEYRDEI